MERALEILMVEYPMLAAMLEEPKTAVSFEVLIYIERHWFLLLSFQEP
jgi:hypothetical protein